MAVAFVELAAVLSVRQTTRLLGVSRATHYRKGKPPAERKARPAPANKLSDAESAHVLSVLRSPRFAELAPAQVWARRKQASGLKTLDTYRAVAHG